jgi:hypothetical protein
MDITDVIIPNANGREYLHLSHTAPVKHTASRNITPATTT